MDRLTSPKIVKEIIEKYGFSFNKRLGQNFLIDENILNKIIETAQISEYDNVLEIGPGIGTVTQALCKYAKKTLCIEIDKNLIPILENNLKECSTLFIKNHDVLKVDLDEVLFEYFLREPVKVVANLPYYAASPIIMRLLECRYNINSITVMVQKEVAERICAKPGRKEYGILSVAVQLYGSPYIACTVPSTVFMPKPNVDSALLNVKTRKELPVELFDRELFFHIVKAAFSKRRKTILNSISGYDFNGKNHDKNTVGLVLEQSGISPAFRAEQLSVEEYCLLANNFYKQGRL